MNNTHVQTIGFARYQARTETAPETLLEACLRWRHEFLDRQHGIVGHRMLGNLRGHYADIIFAETREHFDAMAAAHPNAPSSTAMLQLLDPSTIVLRTNDVLGSPIPVPTDFSCVEYGTFSPKPGVTGNVSSIIDASTRIERDYLPRHPESRGHAIARVDENTFSELAFVHTLAGARRICGGYVDDPSCADLLGQFDPDSTDLDFWFVLA